MCLGDSITQAAEGYVSVMASLIAARYPERGIKIINAGIGGHKAPDLRARLARDVLAHRPDWVTVNVGINDVWHGLSSGGTGGVSVEEYEPTVEQIVRELHEARAQVVLVTTTVIEEDLTSEGNRRLTPYVAAMERVAQSLGARLAPAHADFLVTLGAGQAADPNFRMTTDGVHLNAVGNARLALTILETLDF